MADLVAAGVTVSTDDRGRMHFWGEVFNLGQRTQRWVRVTIALLGERGRHLAEQADIVGLEWTLPGARNPFYLRFLDPPPGMQSFDIRLEGHVHDYSDLSLPQPHPGIVVEKLHYREIERADLRCSIIGLLANKGLAPATHVKAAGTFYDPEGKVVGVLSPYLVSHGALQPGDVLPFELKFYALGGPVANFSVQVQGRSAVQEA
jgi:hypothetical protein